MNRKLVERILIILLILLIALICFDFYTSIPSYNSIRPRISYSRLLDYIQMGWIKQVDLYMNSRIAIVEASSPEFGDQSQLFRVDIPLAISQLIQKLKEYDVNFDSHPIPQKNIYIKIAYNVLLPLIFIGSLVFFFQNSENIPGFPNLPNFPGNPGSFIMNIGKSPARLIQEPGDITFDSVKGIEEVKEEVEEIVSFLIEEEKYTRMGVTIPRGALLVGPPGTGKTLLAKAIAGEAKVPLLSVGGGEFIELFVGVGAARVRDLFTQANRVAPCIIFIDEIDAIARKRNMGFGNPNDEREQTLNQLLSELDGFKKNTGIILVGATNRLDILDDALLRPGRVDRQINVPVPGRSGRLSILKLYAEKLPLADDVSLFSIADKTAGFSGAELANFLNEAAILSIRHKKEEITEEEIDEAFERITGGIAGPPLEYNRNKTAIAYHEVGHAIAASMLKYHADVKKITLIPRGEAKGLTWFNSSDDDSKLYTYIELVARAIMLLSGRASEKLVFGTSELTTIATDDFERATELIFNMITLYGMSELGPRAFLLLNNEGSRSMTPEVRNEVDKVTSKTLKIYEIIASKIVFDNRFIIDIITEELLASETMKGKEFFNLLSQYTNCPEKIDPLEIQLPIKKEETIVKKEKIVSEIK